MAKEEEAVKTICSYCGRKIKRRQKRAPDGKGGYIHDDLMGCKHNRDFDRHLQRIQDAIEIMYLGRPLRHNNN